MGVCVCVCSNLLDLPHKSNPRDALEEAQRPVEQIFLCGCSSTHSVGRTDTSATISNSTERITRPVDVNEAED